MPTISASGFAAMATVTMVLIIQIPGNYSATSSVIDLPQPPAHAINRGIVVDGLTGAISGMLGGVMASMAYVQSLGVVAVTKVGRSLQRALLLKLLMVSAYRLATTYWLCGSNTVATCTDGIECLCMSKAETWFES